MLVTGLLLVGVTAERDGLFAAAGARCRFLPGSNLTNLIVLHHEHVAGATFLDRMWPAAVASVLVTVVVVLVAFRRALGAPVSEPGDPGPARLGVGTFAVAASTVLVLVLSAPALPVFVCGVAAALLARVGLPRLVAAADPRALGGLFVLAVAIGVLGRHWHGPELWLDSGRWQAAFGGAVAAVGLNNLPAAMLFSPVPPVHARALLLGLNLGPNLAVTGSLSAFLWLRVARGIGARPSVRRYTTLGVFLVPLSLVAAVLALSL